MSPAVAVTPERVAGILDALREARPRVHALTNTVVQTRTADGLTALGAVPSMTTDPDEVAEVAGAARALLVNLGTLDRDRRAAIDVAVDLFASSGRPFVLDPVKCDIAERRRTLARALLARKPALVRANADEMAALGSFAGARLETGRLDRIADEVRSLTVANGHPWLADVTGTGCLSGAMAAAFLAVEPDAVAAGVATAVTLGVSAEIAARRSAGPGTFAVHLLDALASLGRDDILALARINR